MGDVVLHIAAFPGGARAEFAWGGANTEPGALCLSHTSAIWARTAPGAPWNRTRLESMEHALRESLQHRSLTAMLATWGVQWGA